MKLHHYTAEELVAIRHKLRLNQAEFWGRFGVTQSGGSRYESGRGMPKPVQILLNIALRPTKTGDAMVESLRNNNLFKEQ